MFAFAAIWRIATICIPIPIIAFVIAFGWWQIDKSSSMRRAVDKAIDKYTNVTELASANAEIAELKRQKLAADGAHAWLQAQIIVERAQAAVADALFEKDTADYAEKLKADDRGCYLDDSDIERMQRDL